MKLSWIIAAMMIQFFSCTQLWAQQAFVCKDGQEIVDKAFSAFITDSTRKPAFFSKAARSAESILKTCSLNNGSRRDIAAKKNILELYAWCLKSLTDYQEFKYIKQPLKIKFLESKIDSLKGINEPLFQPYLEYLRGFYYSQVARNYPLAITSFRKALDHRSNWDAALNELGWAYMLADNYDSARYFADQCRKINPRYVRALVTIGYTYAYAKNMKIAFDNFNEALKTDSLLVSAYLALGWWSSKYQINDSVSYFYSKASKADPEFVSANYSIAGVYKLNYKYYLFQSYFDSAEKYYKKCVDVNPYLPDVYYAMGDLFDLKHDSINMTKNYQAAISLDSSYLFMLGVLDHNKKNYKQAIETYKIGLAYNYDKWTTRNIGVCYYSLGQFAESIKYLEKSIELDSAWSDPHEWLASIYSSKTYKDNEKAIYHLKKAFSSFPDSYNAKRYYSFLTLDRLRNRDTLGAFKLLKEGAKEGCEGCIPLKNALMFEYGFNNEKKDYEEAKEWYQTALRKDSVNFADIVRDAILHLYETDKISVGYSTDLFDYGAYYQRSVNSKTTNADKLMESEKLIRVDEVLLKAPQEKNLLVQIAGNYNDFGWYCLLNKDFTRAKAAIKKGLKLDTTSIYLKGNEPHILLFTGQEEEARKKYTELKDQPFGNKSITGFATFKEAFLADFTDFKKANFSNADLEKIENIKKILNDK